MRQLLCSLLENWLTRRGHQDELWRIRELSLGMPEWLQQHTLRCSEPLLVSGFFVFLTISFFCPSLGLCNNKHHSRIGARNLIVMTLARVIVESTQKMVIKLAKYLMQARSVQVDSFLKILLFARRV